MFKKIKLFLLDLLFPIECLNCNQAEEWLCLDCLAKIKIKNEQTYIVCEKITQTGETCEICKKNNFLDYVWVAGDYSDPILKKAIHLFKFNFCKDLAKPLASLMTDKLSSIKSESAINLIAVPLHFRRERWRGFNQSLALINELQKNPNLTNFKVCANNLKRIKYNKPQAQLGKMERLVNLKDCFIWQGERLDNQICILIDDVVTTGTTLNECAKVLKSNGAKEVFGIALAH